MKENIEPFVYYQQSVKTFEAQLNILYRKRNAIAWFRFVVFIVVCATVYFLWSSGAIAIIAAITCGIILFLFAVSKDAANKNIIKNLETILAINKDETDYLQQQYDSKYNGKNLEPPHHAYAKDLDIFGNTSLFQYINRCNSNQGILLLSERLLQPLSKEKILLQQQTIQELANKIKWWQQFQAFGANEKITTDSEERINKWLDQPDVQFVNPVWRIVLYCYSLITLSTVVLFIVDIITAPVFSALVFIFFITGLAISGKITHLYDLLSKLVPAVTTVYNQLSWFEKESFESSFLTGLQKTLSGATHTKATSSIKQLQKILERFDVRLNVLVFFMLNTFFLWDLWQLIALNNWRKNHKNNVSDWFNVIAQIEVAGSFAVLHFNNPGWRFPEIADEHFSFSCRQAGHPLIIKQQSVTNDFNINGTAKIDLITGSNMAGKSTFLRSIGVNMVLAYAGSCVYAQSFTVSVAVLMSSMRIEDNLAENTSTFYAELKKLKSIIDAVNEEKKLFILLDEILRGTNSLDRHTGSKALIEQLIRKNAVAVIATHDIELSKLENNFPQAIKNYHFDVQVNDNKLFFDYKLKQGICTSMNASILMKQIGIEM